jgi:hypothetical protein
VSLPEQAPQEPPHPSSPHCLPPQLGVQTHWPLALQVSVPGQVPHDPSQPSSPHCLPMHVGWHAESVAELSTAPSLEVDESTEESLEPSLPGAPESACPESVAAESGVSPESCASDEPPSTHAVS